MNNIFKGAKFGDKYVTRDNDIATLISYGVDIIWAVKNEEYPKNLHYYRIDEHLCDHTGNSRKDNNKDIVSKYQEPIDEEKLDDFAAKEAKKWYEPVKSESNYDFWRECFECFKAGYRKAMEE